jgi:hypothetical protein
VRSAASFVLAAWLLAACGAAPGGEPAGTRSPAPEPTCGTDTGTGCAPPSARVDLATPAFSNPTRITNPLFPIAELDQILMLGTVDDLPFRTEVTLLPETKLIELDGQQVEVLVSQYTAYLDRRIHEVALDYYAQADDGSVWYFGEDVFNYADGVVADTDGTWLAGRDGPAAMIMPADPQVGDVYRPENVPGLVFEEVTVASTEETVDGPTGPIEGAIVVDELHMEGTHERKTFAPGYGEFFTDAGGDLEAVALGVPIDAVSGPMPPELESITDAAISIGEAIGSGDWAAASAGSAEASAAWDAYRATDVPERLAEQMQAALDELTAAVQVRDAEAGGHAALDVAMAGLDLQLRHRPLAEVDLDRLELWARRTILDAAAAVDGAIAGDSATLGWIRDRLTDEAPGSSADPLDAALDELREATDAGDADAARAAAESLLEALGTGA